MYLVTALRAVQRVKAARTGVRLRRNPVVVMKDGSTIKLPPGRSVRITDEIYESNKKLFAEFSSMITVKCLTPTVSPTPIEPTVNAVVPPIAPVEEDEEDTIPPKVPAEEPKVIVEEAEVKKPKTRRKKAASEDTSSSTSEDAPKPKRRRRRKSTTNADDV